MRLNPNNKLCNEGQTPEELRKAPSLDDPPICLCIFDPLDQPRPPLLTDPYFRMIIPKMETYELRRKPPFELMVSKGSTGHLKGQQPNPQVQEFALAYENSMQVIYINHVEKPRGLHQVTYESSDQGTQLRPPVGGARDAKGPRLVDPYDIRRRVSTAAHEAPIRFPNLN